MTLHYQYIALRRQLCHRTPEKSKPALPSFASMLKAYVKIETFECILCQSRLIYAEYRAGTSLSELSASMIMSSKRMLIM
nr:Putative transposase [Moritella viscosa]SHO18197.1 Putative transposase [Moritella viscosa]